MLEKLKNKNILITGASSGIGKQMAKLYCQNGANVIAIGRSQSGLEELDDSLQKFDSKCILVPMDLKNYDLIYDLSIELQNRFEVIDALVLNASILGNLTPVTHIDEYDWNTTFSVNLTSNIILLKAFEKLLNKSKQANVLFLTSDIIKKRKPFWGLYSSSKAALEQIAFSYAAEVKNTNVMVNIIDPGAVNTKLRQKAYPGEDKKKIRQPEELSDFLIDIIFNKNYKNSKIISFDKWNKNL